MRLYLNVLEWSWSLIKPQKRRSYYSHYKLILSISLRILFWEKLILLSQDSNWFSILICFQFFIFTLNLRAVNPLRMILQRIFCCPLSVYRIFQLSYFRYLVVIEWCDYSLSRRSTYEQKISENYNFSLVVNSFSTN